MTPFVVVGRRQVKNDGHKGPDVLDAGGLSMEVGHGDGLKGCRGDVRRRVIVGGQGTIAILQEGGALACYNGLAL